MNETKQCSMCGEEILAVAKKCKHCNSDLAASHPGASDSDKAVADYGNALLAIPVVAILLIWFWVSGMSLLQSPGGSLTLIALVTLLGTAGVAAMEASKIGMLRDKEKGTHKPVTWFFLITCIWIVGYPAYLLKRKHYGLKSRFVPGLVIALIFVASWSVMDGAIESKKAEVRSNLEQMQRQLDSLGE